MRNLAVVDRDKVHLRVPRRKAAWRAAVAALLSVTSAFVAAGIGAGTAGAAPSQVLEAWGSNTYGQLGNGTTTQSDTPVSVQLAAGVAPTAIAAGGYHSLALGSNGQLYAWGQNGYGQLGNGTTTQSDTPVSISLPGGVQATKIAAGLIDSLALGSDGHVYAWGDNSFGELGDGSTTDSSTPVEVSLPSGLTFTAIAAGQYTNLALATNGSVYAWGYNNDGQLGDGNKTTPTTPVEVSLPSGVSASQIAAGGYHSLAISTTGQLYAWGYNHYGQLGDGTTTDKTKPTAISMPSGVTATAISAGLYHSLAIGSNGSVYAWGYNTDGELGNGTTTDSHSPTLVSMPSGTTTTSITTGLYDSYALASNGTLYAWGQNGLGQLGNGSTTNETTPTHVTFPANATFTGLGPDSSSSHALAIATPNQTMTTTTLSPSVSSPVYGQSETLTATITGSDGGGTVKFEDGGNSLSGCSAVSLTLSGGQEQAQCTTSSLSAGTHDLTATYSGDTASLGSSSSTLDLSVTQAPLVVTASSGATTYGSAPPAITPSYAGFVNGDTSASLTTQPTCSTTAASTSPAGTYPSSCSGAAAANYSITYANGEVVVAPAPLSISSSSATMTYGGTVPTITPSYTGFVNGDTAASLTTAPTCSTTSTSSSSVGTYPSACSGAVDPNYSFSYTNGQVVVGAAPLVITASSAATTYGTSAGAITPSYSGFLNGDTAASLTTQPTCSTTATTDSPVGTYASSCTGASDPNYSISYVNGSVTVSPAPITITASSASTAYGGSVPAVTPQVSGLQNGEDVSVLGNGLQCSTTATSSSPAGTYASSCSGGSDPNYAITYVQGTITVNPAPLTITASSGTMTYGGAVPTITPTVAGLQNGDSVSVLGAGFGCSTVATPTSPVGSYASSCSGVTDPNYDVSYTNGAVNVTPAPLTITASSGTMAYGAAPPEITPTVGGLQNGEDVSVLGPGLECSTSAVSSSPVGTYSSMCSGAVDSNYDITYIEGSITVTPTSLTVTASSGSVTYGQSPPAVTPSYEGFVNGDTASSLTTTPTCSTTATSSSPVGSYATSCSGAADPNYEITYVQGSISVTDAVLTITASSAPVTYGQSPPAITPSYEGFVNGDTASSLTTPPTCSTPATSSSPVGTYPSSCSGAVDPNYQITYVQGAVVVGQAPLLVIASNGSTQYGQSPAAITPSYEGFVNGDTASSLTTPPTCSTPATSSSPVGSYPSSCSGAVDPNYQITYVNGTVNVSPAPLTVNASSSTVTYGSATPAVTPSYEGFVNGDTASSLTTPPTCSTPATSSSPVGSYPTSCSGASDPNYTISYAAGTVTVSPVPLTVTASSSSITYGSASPSITPSYQGFVNGDTASSLTNPPTCSSTVLPTSPVGTYSTSCSGGFGPNYDITYVEGVVTVAPAPITVTASSGSITYGSAVPSVTPIVTGLQNDETTSVLGSGLACSTTATSSSPVGSYPTSCSGAVDANYTITYDQGTLGVTPAPLTVAASPGSMTYGGAPPTITPTVTGLQNDETTSVLGSGLACSTTATSSSPVGTYPSSCSGAVDANYDITYMDNSVQVTPAPLTVAASSGSMTYGGTVPTITASYSGFVNGDSASSLQTAPTCVTAATANSPAGTYPSSCSGASDPNYNITYVNGSVVVGTAQLVISASSGSMTYGGAAPSVTPSYSGFVNGDTSASLSARPTCSTTATSSSAVGSYPTTCSGASDPNYNITYVSGSATVNPAPLTITASSASMVYGSSAPAIKPTVTGLVNGQSASVLGSGLSCSTSATSSSPVGSYASNCSGASDSNYAITYLAGTVQVTPATLTVTANNQTMAFGSAVPALTYTITGYVDGQTLATSGVTGDATCTATATNMSPAGTYPITCTIGTLKASNYTFTFVPGTLTVTNTQTIVCDTIGQVTVSAGQSVKIAPGCIVLGSVTVKAGGSLDVDGALVLGQLVSNGSLRICSSSVGLILQATGSAMPVVVGDGTSDCEGSVLVGGIDLSTNSAGVSLQRAGAVGLVYVQQNTGPVTVINNTVLGVLKVTGNSGTVVDRPNTVVGIATLQ